MSFQDLGCSLVFLSYQIYSHLSSFPWWSTLLIHLSFHPEPVVRGRRKVGGWWGRVPAALWLLLAAIQRQLNLPLPKNHEHQISNASFPQHFTPFLRYFLKSVWVLIVIIKMVVVPSIVDFSSMSSWFTVVLRTGENPVGKSWGNHMSLVSACCPGIIINNAFHSSQCPGLDNKLYSHPITSLSFGVNLTWIQTSALLPNSWATLDKLLKACEPQFPNWQKEGTINPHLIGSFGRTGLTQCQAHGMVRMQDELALIPELQNIHVHRPHWRTHLEGDVESFVEYFALEKPGLVTRQTSTQIPNFLLASPVTLGNWNVFSEPHLDLLCNGDRNLRVIVKRKWDKGTGKH